MAKPKIKTTQEDPTAEMPRCPKTGRPLDQWGLPLNGPARAVALAELGKPDPRDEPEAWEKGDLVVPPVVLTGVATDAATDDDADAGAGDDSTDLNGDQSNG